MPQVLTAVELGEGMYEVPQDVEKVFYRDLTFMEDEELVKKYGLVKVEASRDAEEEESGEAEGSLENGERDPEVSFTKFV